MSIRAGSIVMVGGRNIIDRLQSAGLDGQVPMETVREIGNDLVVDKIPTEPDFTFRLESWDVTTDMMAFLQGKTGSPAVGSPPGDTDAAGFEYRWENCQSVNVISPWKRDTGSQGGHIAGGLIVPAYYPTRLRYRYGVTDMAVQEAELAGGSFFYAKASPREEVATGDGTDVTFVTSSPAVALRIGGAGGDTFRRVFGVHVNGVPQTRGVEYTESVTAAPDAGAPGAATITFAVAPPAGASIRLAYFADVEDTWAQATNADATVKPGAVRGRNIEVLIGDDGSQVRLPGTQSFELEATVETETEREMGNEEPTGRAVNGIDATGNFVLRPKNIDSFFNALNLATGVSVDEVHGYFNQTEVPLEVRIQNPKNPSEILKTLYVSDARIQPPPLAARVNTSTDFTFNFAPLSGSFDEIKGARVP